MEPFNTLVWVSRNDQILYAPSLVSHHQFASKFRFDFVCVCTQKKNQWDDDSNADLIFLFIFRFFPFRLCGSIERISWFSILFYRKSFNPSKMPHKKKYVKIGVFSIAAQVDYNTISFNFFARFACLPFPRLLFAVYNEKQSFVRIEIIMELSVTGSWNNTIWFKSLTARLKLNAVSLPRKFSSNWITNHTNIELHARDLCVKWFSTKISHCKWDGIIVWQFIEQMN